MATTKPGDKPEDKTAAKLKARINRWESYVLQETLEVAPAAVTRTDTEGTVEQILVVPDSRTKPVFTGAVMPRTEERHRVSLVPSHDQDITVSSIPTIEYVSEDILPRKSSRLATALRSVLLFLTLMIALIAGVAFYMKHA